MASYTRHTFHSRQTPEMGTHQFYRVCFFVEQMLRIGTIYSLNAKLHRKSGRGFLDCADNTGLRGGGITNFSGLLDVRVNPYALSSKGLLGEPP